MAMSFLKRTVAAGLTAALGLNRRHPRRLGRLGSGLAALAESKIPGCHGGELTRTMLHSRGSQKGNFVLDLIAAVW